MSEIQVNKLVRFGNLELLARQAVEGFITGMHKSPFHGFSVEFAEHRLYNKGESTRHIDWKLYARTEKLFVKRYEEETNLRCRIIMDCSASMYFPVEENKGPLPQNKIGFSIYAAASLIELLRRQRDAVGITLYSDKIETATAVKSSFSHIKHIYNELEKRLDFNEFRKGKKTETAKLLHEIAETIHRRSLVIVFSDMFGNIDTDGREALFSSLQHLKFNKHEVILFHTTHKAMEMNLEFDNKPHKFIDLETGEEVRLNPSEIREEYQKQAAAYENELKLKCASYGIDFIQADVSEGIYKILTSFMVKRSKMF